MKDLAHTQRRRRIARFMTTSTNLFRYSKAKTASGIGSVLPGAAMVMKSCSFENGKGFQQLAQ
jgi:hypothetical protein